MNMKSRSAMLHSWQFLYFFLLLSAHGENFMYTRRDALPLRAPRAKQLLERIPGSQPLQSRRVSAGSLACNLRGGGLPSIVNFNALADTVSAMGSAAPLGFALIFCALELIGIPVAPMGPLAGMLFSVPFGAALVLSCGTFTAIVAFLIGRQFQERILRWLVAHPSFYKKFENVNKIITKGGFRAVFLLRVLPTPVPYINYIFGLTSLKFPEYALATVLGYLPGTIAFVSSGAVGKAIIAGAVDGVNESALRSQPWHMYATVAVFGLGVLMLAKSTFAEIVREVDVKEKMKHEGKKLTALEVNALRKK